MIYILATSISSMFIHLFYKVENILEEFWIFTFLLQAVFISDCKKLSKTKETILYVYVHLLVNTGINDMMFFVTDLCFGLMPFFVSL